MMLACVIVLAGGSCATSPVPAPAGPLFCDVERARRFSLEEANWRADHAPENLRLDVATNEAGELYCGWAAPSAKKGA